MRKLIAVVFTALLILTLSMTVLGNSNRGNYKVFPDTGMVTYIEQREDCYCLEFTLQDGNIFSIYVEDGDWYIGDIISVMFNNMGTEDIVDDVIVEYKYSGWVDDIYNWVK